VHAVLKTHEKGLAAAIGTGIQRATGDHLLVMDTDFTHRPEEIPVMLQVSQVCDIVSGSRFCAGGQMSSVRHYIFSFLYNVVLRIILRTQIQDNLGGYWIARRALIQGVNAKLVFSGYGDYYFKLLKLLLRQGARIIEIPSCYAARHEGDSKSNFFRLLFSYTHSALMFRWYLVRHPQT
jgi:dolichol-phosphate mannosyltransferase